MLIQQLAKKTVSLVLASFFSVLAFAQEKKIEVDINTKSESDGWWMQPWVWVVGGAIFILLLVALLRGGRKQ